MKLTWTTDELRAAAMKTWEGMEGEEDTDLYQPALTIQQARQFAQKTLCLCDRIDKLEQDREKA